MPAYSAFRALGVVVALIVLAAPAAAQDAGGDEPTQATTLLDLSGLAPLGAGQVLAVHDAKTPDEDDRPRASLLTETGTPAGVTWQAVAIEWPADGGPANDLESATAIPGQASVILAESGDDASDFQRLFLVDLDLEGASPTGTISAVTTWPSPVFNVESVAVAQADDDLVLLWAERAQGQRSTKISSAPLRLSPFAIGSPTSVNFRSPAVRGPGDRPVSAMEVGPDGTIYVASAFDSGSDDGPYSSTVWMAGWVTSGPDGAEVVMARKPKRIATIDGFKTESLAIVEAPDGSGSSLHLGTDDENDGGVLRPLPAK